MLKKTLTISFIVASSFVAHSQIGIGTTSPKASSKLDITASDKGLLIPRIALLSNTDIVTIVAPEKSLLIYNTATTSIGNATDVKEGFYYFNGTTWLPINSGDTPIQLTNDNYHTSNTTSGSSGTGNLLFGKDAGKTNSGNRVVAIGLNAGGVNVKDNLLAIGNDAGTRNIGEVSTLVGEGAGINNSGNASSSFGVYAGANNTGQYTNSIGFTAGHDNKGVNSNLFGSNAGRNNEGDGSNIIGEQAGYRNKGFQLNALGVRAGRNNTGLNVNSIGFEAGLNNIGNYNVFIGRQSGLNNTASYVQAIGYHVGTNNKGAFNTFIGANLVQQITGGNNILMGSSVEVSSLSGYNQINLANRIVVNENSFVGLGGILDPKEKLHLDAVNDSLQVDNLAGEGTVLTINSNGKIFRSSSNKKSALIKTADYTIGVSDEVILADATSAEVTITFPASPVNGQTHTVKRINGGGSNVILNGNGNNLDGLANKTITDGYQFYTYLFHTNNWYLINQ